ncbi:MAG: ribonuclease Z [Lachnospiraceae bacterium]
MIIVFCIDDKNGMMFNGRRQSQDRILREKILADAENSKIWMNSYSAKLFSDVDPGRIQVDEDFLEKAGNGEVCLVENVDVTPYLEKAEEIILYKWNRTYPADTWFDTDLTNWKMVETIEFVGSSHEKITKERYRR